MSLDILAIALGAFSVIAALGAAVLWFLSAVIKTPESFSIYVARPDGIMGTPLGGDPLGGKYLGHAYSEDLVKLANALRRQARLSGWGATMAALAALFQAGALIAQICFVAA